LIDGGRLQIGRRGQPCDEEERSESADHEPGQSSSASVRSE
jgi:hypothetical protein